MSLPSRPFKILLLVVAFAATGLLPGCANKDDDKPWHKKESKWYQSDMDSEDRQFFLGSFLDNGGGH
ncbi:MAG: hypothetical protein P4L99_19080 [Chthoniobacter sp.]|nr:hypothetical protein [Chthoniobacter sp.]